MLTIFKKVTRAQAAAAGYFAQPEMKPLVDLFKETLEETKTGLVSASDTVHIHRLQGRAQVMEEILELVTNASQILGRMK